MDTRRFLILETLITNGDSTERQVMKKLWFGDKPNMDERFEPWAWYYNTTKVFAPLEKRGFIECTGEDSEGRKVWRILPDGAKLFVEAVEEGTIFRDPFYQGKEEDIEEIVRNLAS